ncbi:4-diphosphocytidyl-2-C-methyl-D-erythritol kinase [bioreactor metagenome]|uniref:4-diphosphocytidyl-2-C-methyl-D-erythritol kinase n=1 Tax=bioreactor metagenome TaxID=1076179 RepID=A0A645JJV8_9ZZZZ
MKPKRGVSTKRAFEQLNLLQLTHPDARAVQACLMANDYPGLLSRMGNDLQSSAALFVPEIELLITDLKKFGFDQALMSGSGSTVFGITQDENLVNRAISVFQRRYPFVKKTKIIDI